MAFVSSYQLLATSYQLFVGHVCCTGLRMAKKRLSTKRDLVKSRTGKSFAKRTAKGRFKEMDGVKRSLASDTRKKAKRKTKSGHGDQGDRK